MEKKMSDALKWTIQRLNILYQIGLSSLAKLCDSRRFSKILERLVFWISIFIIIYFLISLPLAITLWLFPLNSIPLATGQDSEISVIERIGVITPTFRSLLADSLQVPLKLDWYNIHFQYDLKIPQGMILKKLPEITLRFTKGSPNKYDSNILPLAENDDRNFGIPPWENAYNISATSSLVFPYLATDSLIWQSVRHMDYTNIEKDDSLDPSPSFLLQKGYGVYATPHPIAWFVKFILISMAFYGILNFILKLIRQFFILVKWFRKKLSIH